MTFAAEIESALRLYEPTDPRERVFLDRMRELNRHPDAHVRHHFEPGHFTASAFILSPDRDSVLLIFHKKLGKWLQPGGHVDPGDASPLGTAEREVLEEVGLHDLTSPPSAASVFDIDVHPIPARATEPAHEHFDLRFLFVAPSRDFDTTSEVGGAKWVRLLELPRVTDDESVLRAIRKIQGF